MLHHNDCVGWCHAITVAVEGISRVAMSGCTVHQTPHLFVDTVPVVEDPLEGHLLLRKGS